jgi:hypothetical protein
MIISQSHTLTLVLSRARAAEAVAWLFENVTRFEVETEAQPDEGLQAGFTSLGLAYGGKTKVTFYELEDAAKFKLFFGDDQ